MGPILMILLTTLRPYLLEYRWNTTSCRLSPAAPEPVPAAAAATAACPDHWWGYDQFCYRTVSSGQVSLNWHKARLWCASQALGGDLAVIHNRELNRLVTDDARSVARGEVWIGASDQLVESEFRWVDGQLLGRGEIVPWGPGQPDNTQGSQHCVSLSVSNYTWARVGQWDDDHCSFVKGGFVCQMKP